MAQRIDLSPQLVRVALHRAPTTVRLKELLEVGVDDVMQLWIREAVDELVVAGEVERLAIGEHIVLKPTEEFEPPERGQTAPLNLEQRVARTNDQWGAWVRRARERERRCGG